MAYVLGEQYKQRVDRALSVVEGMPSQGGITRIPTRFETLQQPGENPLRLAAYPRDLDWKKGHTAQISIYTHSGTAYGPLIQGSGVSATMVTATALNVSHDLGLLNPASTSPDDGPTPTMTWCIVGRRNGIDMLVEGPDQPQVGLATISVTAIGDVWLRDDARAARDAATGETVAVVSVFDNYTPLDFSSGLSYAKSVNPLNVSETANVIIGPPAIPLHAALSTESSWPRGEDRVVSVPPAGERTTEVQVVASNRFFDDLDASSGEFAIGRVGTSFSVLTAPQQGGITPGTLVTPISFGEVWDKGSIRSVYITGSTTQVDVVNPFDELTHLEGHEGVLFAKSQKDPNGGEGTVNVLISPAPKELYEAHFSSGASEEWDRDATKTLLVPAGDGRDEEVSVTVVNKFFDTFTIAQEPVAIGRVGTAFCALTQPISSDVRMATRIDNATWNAGSERQVRVHGTTTNVTAINLAGDYEPWDAKTEPYGPHLAIVKGKNLGIAGGGASEGTMWYVISPAPQTFRTGTFTGQWAKGSSKTVTLLSDSGPTGTVTAVNIYGSVGSTVTSSVAKNCGISKAGGTWYLVAAECE